MELTPVETRVLGCLLEKERTTPDAYPLTLNSLLLACNQSTNREPILLLNEREIEEALDGLRQKKLATVIFGGGSRVQKYRHILPDTYNFSPQEYALLCVLLLRGPQTLGELRGRTETNGPFPDAGRRGKHPRRPGRRQRTSGALVADAARPEGTPLRATPLRRTYRTDARGNWRHPSSANARRLRRPRPTTRRAWKLWNTRSPICARSSAHCVRVWTNCAALWGA